MGRTGRKTEREEAFASFNQSKPAPPSGLPREAKKTWREIVESLPSGHFRSSELPLLEKYVLADHLYHEAIAKVLRADEVDESGAPVGPNLAIVTAQGYELPNIYLTVANKQVQIMSMLATKLRIATNSRLTNKGAAQEREPKPNKRRKGLMYGA